MSYLFHLLSGAGRYSDHLRQLLGQTLADSSLSERRQILPWVLFTDWMRATLKPLAQKGKHPEAFYRNKRIIALDGTKWSVQNTRQILKQCTKTLSRRMKAAFAKIPTVVMLEIGLHNPLAAAIGKAGESEWSLAQKLLAQLPKGVLLLADRLYGYGAMIGGLIERCEQLDSWFLIRVQRRNKAHRIERLADGSCLIEVQIRDPKNHHKIIGKVRLREIRARVMRKGCRGQSIRLWTNVLDWTQAPANELISLYTKRWEHELYYRHLKLELHRGELLQSQTLETAVQEIATLIIGSALLAQERARAAGGKVPVLQISFVQLLDLLHPLWLTLQLGEDILDADQKRRLGQRFMKEARKCLKDKKRHRSCPRAVRQPVSGWPRLLKNYSLETPVEIKILPRGS